MSEILKDRVMILRTFDFGETSVVAVALTREHGKLRIIAKGARRPRSPFGAMLRTGSIGDIVFYHREERGLQLLKEFSSDESGGIVTEDFVKLCLFQAGLELIDTAIVGRESDTGTFDILEAFKTGLFASQAPWYIFFTLEVGLLKALGVLPPFEVCAGCGRALAQGCSADPVGGLVTCARCAGEAADPLSACSRATILAMENEPFDPSAAVEPGPRERKEIGQLLHHLFLHHVEGYRLPNALHLLKGVN